jgi:hypothetical protein
MVRTGMNLADGQAEKSDFCTLRMRWRMMTKKKKKKKREREREREGR